MSEGQNYAQFSRLKTAYCPSLDDGEEHRGDFEHDYEDGSVLPGEGIRDTYRADDDDDEEVSIRREGPKFGAVFPKKWSFDLKN